MLPKKVQKNQPITADLFNSIIDSIRECQIQSGVGYSFSRTAGGTTLSISIPKAGQPAVVAEACPFDVSTSISGGSYLIKVDVGTVNGIYATNYANCLSFDSTTLTVASDGTTNVVVDVTTDGKQVTAFELATSANMVAMTPTTPLAPTSFKWPLAHIINGTVYKTIGCGSLQAVVKENVRVAKAPSSPDDNAYDIYYYWVLESL